MALNRGLLVSTERSTADLPESPQIRAEDRNGCGGWNRILTCGGFHRKLCLAHRFKGNDESLRNWATASHQHIRFEILQLVIICNEFDACNVGILVKMNWSLTVQKGIFRNIKLEGPDTLSRIKLRTGLVKSLVVIILIVLRICFCRLDVCRQWFVGARVKQFADV